MIRIRTFCLAKFLGIALISLQSSAHAIVNVEQAIIGRPGAGWHSRLEALASGASGNTDKSTVQSNLLTTWQHGAHTEFLQMQYAYGQSRGQTDTDRAFMHVRHRTTLSDVWGLEEFFQVGRDTFARLTLRRLLGAGLRHILFEEPGVAACYLGLGGFYEQEILSAKFGTTDPVDTSLWRANSYLVLQRQFNDQVRFNNTLYYQPALANAANYRILEQASMLVKLGQSLDLKLTLDISYDSLPPQTVERRDMLYSTGLEFSF